MQIQYKFGDACSPPRDRPVILCHVVNSVGCWGAGFVVALSRRWALPESAYHRWYENGRGFELGAVQLVEVEPGLTVANMVGQVLGGKFPPIRYPALRECLRAVREEALARGAVVVGPRFGAGLAGGDWLKIEKLINQELIAHGVEVTIYDLPPRPALAPVGRVDDYRTEVCGAGWGGDEQGSLFE